MSLINKVEILLVDLYPKTKRTDAIQSFQKQETPIILIHTTAGEIGVGYTYTIGTGGRAVVEMLEKDLCPLLIDRDPSMISSIWNDLFFSTHATAIGAITSLSLAAIDTALWDLKCKRAKLPLHVAAGGAQTKIPIYTTEGGWLHKTTSELVTECLEAKSQGFFGCKIKVGKPHCSEDLERLSHVRKSVGPSFEIMVDANQKFTVSEAIRRAKAFEGLDLGWFEEPLPAEDIQGHAKLARSTSIPIAVGESIYHLGHFKEYLVSGACSIVQVDVARIGGITPWIKTANLAESFNVSVCPHFLMELHVGLCGAVTNARWVEFIPQLDDITKSRIKISDGYAFPSTEPGLGIDWDFDKIEKLCLSEKVVG